MFELALQNLSRSRLEDLIEERGIRAGAFLRAVVAGDDAVLVGAAFWHSIGLTLFVLFCGWTWVYPAMLAEGGAAWGPIWRTLAIVVVLLLLRLVATLAGEGNAERQVLAGAWIASIILFPLRPLVAFFGVLKRTLERGLGRDAERTEDDLEEEVIAAVTDGELDGVVEEGQRAMIKSIFDLKDSDVADILTPRTEMVSISVESSLAEALAVAVEKGHSRLPVHEETRDNVIGIFYVKDALEYWGKEADAPPLAELIRPPVFVPETKNVSEFLQEMQRDKTHIAVVLDEYGGTAGIVTIEDILEEIVGEIQDEFDKEDDTSGFRLLDRDTLVTEAWVHVSDVNEALEVDFIPEDEDYETIGGLVLSELGHIPAPGESFVYKSLHVHVLDADERKVLRVKLHRDRELEETKK